MTNKKLFVFFIFTFTIIFSSCVIDLTPTICEPTNVKVESTTENSVVISWDYRNSNISYVIQYQAIGTNASQTNQIYFDNLRQNSYNENDSYYNNHKYYHYYYTVKGNRVYAEIDEYIDPNTEYIFEIYEIYYIPRFGSIDSTDIFASITAKTLEK